MRLHEKELLDHSLLLEQLVDAGYCGEGIKNIAGTFLSAINYGTGIEVLEIINPELKGIIKSYYDLATVQASDEQTYLDESVVLAFIDLTVNLEVKTLLAVDALEEEQDTILSKGVLVSGAQTISHIMASGLANKTAVDLVIEGAELYVNLIQLHPDEVIGTNYAVSRELFRASANANISEYRTNLVIPHLIKSFRLLMSDLTYRIKELPYVTDLPNTTIKINSDDSEVTKSFLRSYASLVMDTIDEDDEEESEEESPEEQARKVEEALAAREARRLERQLLAEETQEDEVQEEVLTAEVAEKEETLTEELVEEEEEFIPADDAVGLTEDGKEEIGKSQEELDEVIDKSDYMPDASQFGRKR